MYSLATRLRNKIDVYAKVENKTEFGELKYDYKKIANIWAEVLPKSGKEKYIEGNSIQVSVTHKITVRSNAIKEPRNDMYFIFKGQRYDVLYFMPNYQKNNLTEFYCKLVIETEEDYQ